jgi:hypothetical protein
MSFWEGNNPDIPRRTLFLGEEIFYPYVQGENGKYPWEEPEFVAQRIVQLLENGGWVFQVREVLDVRFSRALSDRIGQGKWYTKELVRRVLELSRHYCKYQLTFGDIDIHAPQK